MTVFPHQQMSSRRFMTKLFHPLPSWLGLLNIPTASLQRGKTPHSNECPGYNTKQSDGESLVILELWGMWNTSSLASLPGPLWPRVVAPDKVPIYGLNRTKPWFGFTGFLHLNCVCILNWFAQNRTVLTSKLCVVYWPTTSPGCQNRKCTYVNNRCIRSRNIRIITLTMDGLNECNYDAHKKVGVELLYNSVKTGSQRVGDKMW